MKFTLKVWRQKNVVSKGDLKTYFVEGSNRTMSFLEMLDVFNTRFINKDEEPITFYRNCLDGICATYSVQKNGRPHGP